MNIEALWMNFLDDIKENISSLSYETWFRDTKLVSLRNNIAQVVVPMPVHKKHLLENYKDLIEEKFNNLTNSTFSFNFLLNEEWEIIKNEETDVNFIAEKHINKEDTSKKVNFVQIDLHLQHQWPLQRNLEKPIILYFYMVRVG